MEDKELEGQNQAAGAVEEANDQEEQALAGAQPMQPMQNEGENEQGQAQAPENADDQAAQVDAQVDAAAEEAGNQAQGEDPQEANEEEEEGDQGEQGGDPQNEQPQNMDAKAQEANLANDEVNQEIVNMAADVGMENEEEEEEGDPDRAFDTLNDLNKLNGENDNEEGGGEDKNAGLKKQVMQLRKGNLYKAVIFSRMLENGENPAGEEQELEEKKQAAGGGRFNRFLNSSKLDKAGKVMKLTNAGSGLLGMASSTYKNSGISKLIGKANDVIVLVNSIRGIIKKLRDFKKNSTSKTKKAFAVIGLIQDFGMAISKGASLAQGIAKRRGWGILETVLGYISSIANIAGQVATLVNVSNTLKQAVQSMAPIKKAQKQEEANVKAVLQKYENADAAENAEEDPEEEEEEEEEQGQEENKKEKKGKGKGKAKKEKKPKKPKKERPHLRKNKALKAKIRKALERPDISDEDKAVLASYLGRDRILAKKKFAIYNVSSGLITAALGLGGSISKSVASNTEGGHQERATLSATIFGGAANGSILLSEIGSQIGNKKVNSGPGEAEGNLIKEGLYGALHNLGSDDKYGLRKVAANLSVENPNEEKVTEANDVVKKYETASKQLEGSGVNYAQLFKAKNMDAFKNSLIASL
ncbi:MAG: hypothetical protein HDR25_02845 [Lachnospiraceae bacterium]|nr:hypothetical protein [Lachnospiraceae bacterium]